MPAGRVTDKDSVAEFGVSVSSTARGLGIGTKLFERAAIHCRNSDVDTLYMQCLSSNQTMMHIAKKAGMEIQREHGEADAYLRLLPPSPGTVLQEAIEEQVAIIDYTLKANTRAADKVSSGRAANIGAHHQRQSPSRILMAGDAIERPRSHFVPVAGTKVLTPAAAPSCP